MAKASVPQERRDEIRYNFCGDLPARLLLRETQEEIAFVLVDVSRRGMGLLLSPAPQVGTAVTMCFESEGVSTGALQFRICFATHAMQNAIPGLETMRRCGCILELDESEEKLDLVEFMGRFPGVLIGE